MQIKVTLNTEQNTEYEEKTNGENMLWKNQPFIPQRFSFPLQPEIP